MFKYANFDHILVVLYVLLLILLLVEIIKMRFSYFINLDFNKYHQVR